MTDNALSSLAELARNASPGPWTRDPFSAKYDSPGHEHVMVRAKNGDIPAYIYGGCGAAARENNSSFIIAANPVVVLELIEEIRRLRKNIIDRDHHLSLINCTLPADYSRADHVRWPDLSNSDHHDIIIDER